MQLTQIDNGRIRVIHALLSKIDKAGDKEFKSMLVGQYSNYRETSTKMLYREEADEMIGDLQRWVGWSPEEIQANKKRRLMLHYAHEMMWWVPGTEKADISRVNEWAKKYGYLHKALDEYTLTELSQLVNQFEQVYKHYLKST